MKILILALMLVTPFVHSSIFQDAYAIKEKVLIYLGFKKEKKIEPELPEIPTVNRNAKDTSQYNRKTDPMIKSFSDSLSDLQKEQLNSSFINEAYTAVLGREPLHDEYAAKISVLQQGGSREGLYRSIVLGSKYQSFEKGSDLTSNKTADFLTQILPEFTGFNMEKERLTQINFYTVKRVVTERFLEVIDAYDDEDNLRRWFAVLSHKLEESAPKTWKQRHRTFKSKNAYYHWSKKIPRDILKSEVYLRLHLLLNKQQFG